MNGPIISLDVSKGESHVKGFLSNATPYGKVFTIKHNTDGFNELKELKAKLEKETGDEPVFVLESTGVYSKTVENYLSSSKYKFHLISPLESAKMRKAEIRPTKNDCIDTDTIAKVFYMKEHALITTSIPNSNLQQMSRGYFKYNDRVNQRKTPFSYEFRPNLAMF